MKAQAKAKAQAPLISGPALLFEQVKRSRVQVLSTNEFGMTTCGACVSFYK